MNTFGWIELRLLVPRWRSFSRTQASGELASFRKLRASDQAGLSSTTEKVARWRDSPGLLTAAEAVEAALGGAREDAAVDAARAILRDHVTAAPMVRNQAAALLRRAGLAAEAMAHALPHGPDSATEWRASLRLYPHDAIGWTELAFHQVVRGHSDAALRSMSVALGLAPHNRHVIRSAARLFLHRQERDRAHDLVLRNPASRTDPWLVAAEIALAGAADRSPRFLKLGEGFMGAGDHSTFDLSELAGAIGTVHVQDGYRKGARRMFVRSMEDPTASALAQGEWASRKIGDELVPYERLDSVPEAFEALALHRYREFRFAEVPDLCEDWARTDCFSVRPFEFGSAAAAHALDFARAADLARKGLALRPNGTVLANCLAFALGSMGDVQGATEALRRLVPDRLAARQRNVRAANVGLCAFRMGQVEEGIAAYRTAIEGLAKLKAPAESASARAYLAREAALAGHPDAPKFLHEAEQALKPYKHAEVHLVLRRLRGENVEAQLADAKQEQERARKLERLRAVTWTTPGLPGQEGVVHRLKL